jgi:hypothetical protein
MLATKSSPNKFSVSKINKKMIPMKAQMTRSSKIVKMTIQNQV